MSPEATLRDEAITTPRKAESAVVPEYDKLDLVATVIVSGPSSSGKNSLEEILKARYGWPTFESSDHGFKRRGESQSQGPIKRRAKNAHESFDSIQARIFRELKPEDIHKIHQTRLGGIILAEERDKRGKLIGKIRRKNEWRAQRGDALLPVPNQIPAVSILLWARKDVRIERAYQSTLREWENEVNIATEQGAPIPPKPVKAEIQAQIEEREAKDVIAWDPIHKYVHAGENPFSRTLTRENGGPVYDRWIDTSDLTPDEVADKFVEIALATGAARFHVEPNDSVRDLRPGELIEGRKTTGSLPPTL